ncbi:MAG: MMPL family transporter [Actinomycetota bacterium]|nr:MMPL family transporter [Actinomycetota bacterium]
MARWTSFMLHHRLWVGIAWLLIAVAGGATASTTVSRLSFDFSLPGQPAYVANTSIADTFGGGGQSDPLLMVLRPAVDSAAVTAVEQQEFSAVLSRVTRALPGTRVVAADEARALASGAVRVAVLYPPTVPGADPYARAVPVLQQLAATANIPGASVQLTGFSLLASGGESGNASVLVDVIVGGAGALLVLILVFGSLLAAVPLLVAAVSILGTFLCLLGLTAVTDVSFVVQFLVALIGLGVAIDYSLLIVMRWREERALGYDNDTAVRTAMASAGRAVLFSGITVAISLAALVVVPLPFLRSIGLGGLLIPLLSVAAATTMVPALLSRFGPRLQWPRRTFRSPTSRLWARLATWVVRRRWFVIVGCVVALLALATPILGLALGSPQIAALDGSPAVTAAARAVTAAGIPPGVLRPVELVVDAAAASADVTALQQVPGVAAAVAPSGAGWQVGGQQLLQVWMTADPATDAGRGTLAAVRATNLGQVGGSPAEDADFVSAVYGDAVWIALAVVVVTFVLLARALRSLWLPVKALLLNAISLTAAYGVTALIWQHGVGTELLFGTRASGSVTTWVPIAAFSFLFGLSMDYEVFILSRMRESWDEHHDTPKAVVDGIANTGRLVTSAALILFLSFVALSTVPTVEVKILATTLALGIAIDAIIVRGLLAPALVAVLGHVNWTLPRWLGQPLRVPVDERRR